MATQVVPLETQHLPGVAGLEKICFTTPWSEESLRTELSNPMAVMLCAVDEQGRVLGWAGFQHILGEGSVTNVAVAPEVRRRGIGQALMAHLLDKARMHALASLTLEVRASNVAAIALYENLGFKVLGRRPGFYEAPREDALMMRIDLSERKTPIENTGD